MRRATGGALIGKASVAVAAHGTKSVPGAGQGAEASRRARTTWPRARRRAGPTRARSAVPRAPPTSRSRAVTRCAASSRSRQFEAAERHREGSAPRRPPPARPARARSSQPGDRVWPELGNGGYQSDPQRRLHQLRRRHQQVPAGHARRADAEVDAVPERVQPGLRSQEQHLEHGGRAGLGHDGPVDHDRRRPGHVRASCSRPTPATRTGRTIPTRSRTPRRTPTRCRRPTRIRRRARRSTTPPPTRACSAVRPSSSSRPRSRSRAGTNFKVVINYVGPAGHPRRTRRWAPRAGSSNNTPAGDGAMVTSEPSGSMAWMPLNNHVSVKPTYDVHSTVNYDPAAAPEANRVFIGPGRLVSKVVNAPDANYPTGGSRTFNWHSAEPIASYLVENSVGHFDESERMATAGDVIYYQYQSSNITAARKASNKAIMDMQEDITHFQESGQRAVPVQRQRHRRRAAERVLPGGDADEDRLRRRQHRRPPRRSSATRTCTSGGATRSSVRRAEATRSSRRATRDASQYLLHGATSPANAAGPVGSAAYKTAFEASHRRAASTRPPVQRPPARPFWSVVPTNPTSGQLFGTSNTYNAARPVLHRRCGRSWATDQVGQGQQARSRPTTATARSRPSR